MDHDAAWKIVLEKLFEEFLAFFFPEIHKDIDFSKGYVFKDKELHKITKDSKTGKRVVDKLVQVYLFNGAERLLFIHLLLLSVLI